MNEDNGDFPLAAECGVFSLPHKDNGILETTVKKRIARQQLQIILGWHTPLNHATQSQFEIPVLYWILICLYFANILNHKV